MNPNAEAANVTWRLYDKNNALIATGSPTTTRASRLLLSTDSSAAACRRVCSRIGEHPPNLGVMASHVTCPRTGDQTRQGPAGDGGQRKVDNIRVAEQVVKKWLDGGDGIRASELKQDDANPARGCVEGRHFR